MFESGRNGLKDKLHTFGLHIVLKEVLCHFNFDYLAWNETLWLWGKYFLSISKHHQPTTAKLHIHWNTVINTLLSRNLTGT